MKKILILILFLFWIPAFAVSEKQKLVNACQDYTDEQIIENQALKCKKAIASYLQKAIDNKIPRNEQGLYSSLSIGLRAQIPQAYKLIEKEIYNGEVNEWTDKLAEVNFELYGKSLTNWARHVEAEVRKIYKITQDKKQDYNSAPQIDPSQKSPELMSVLNPILMTKYIDFLSSKFRNIEVEDFESTNLIYAFSTASFRDIFQSEMSDLILMASDKWIQSIRSEPTWVLFRIFPVISKHADGNIKRELIWLSKYHKDFKIRALALSTIEKFQDS